MPKISRDRLQTGELTATEIVNTSPERQAIYFAHQRNPSRAVSLDDLKAIPGIDLEKAQAVLAVINRPRVFKYLVYLTEDKAAEVNRVCGIELERERRNRK